MKKLSTYRRGVLILLSIGLLLILLSTFRPLPKATGENCQKIAGHLMHIEEAGNDIVFKLKDDNDTYYINRGLERGLTMEELRQLEGKEIALYYIENWSPFDAMHQVRHIAKVEAMDKIVYNEIEE